MLRTITGAAAVVASLVALAAFAGAAAAQEVLKLGLIQSLTGAFNTSGKAAVNGALLYLRQQARSLPAARSRSPSRMMRRRQMPLKDLLRN